MEEQRCLMKEVLEDARMVTLQREGGAVLARMRREDHRFPQSEDYRCRRSAAVTASAQVNVLSKQLFFFFSSLQRRPGVSHCSVQPGGGEASHAGDEIERVSATPRVPLQAQEDGIPNQHGSVSLLHRWHRLDGCLSLRF